MRLRSSPRVFVVFGIGVGAITGYLAAELRTRSPGHPAFEAEAADPDPATLVLVHSLTGRTALVGRELAAMFGARQVRVHLELPDPSGTPVETPRHGSPVVPTEGVTRIFLGFPIWGLQPPAPVLDLVSRMDLAGRRVVPFFTYLHAFDPASFDRLKSLVVERGGTWADPIGTRVATATTPRGILRAVHEAVRGRTDLWPSDAPGPPSCRPDGSGHEVCRVTGGPVWLGDFGSEAAPDGYPPPRLVSVPGFDMDRTEVTVSQYRRCVEAGACPHLERLEGSFCRTLLEAGEDLPIPCVSFEAALAYCRWRGKRLPIEAEWIRAARGSTARAFPWGDEPPSSRGPLRGDFGEKPGRGYPRYSVVSGSADWPTDGFPGLAPPCQFPAGSSPWGICDLAGNLAEWVTLGRSDSGPPVLKGGSWLSGEAWSLAVGSRVSMSLEDPGQAFGFFLSGFRCVRPAP